MASILSQAYKKHKAAEAGKPVYAAGGNHRQLRGASTRHPAKTNTQATMRMYICTTSYMGPTLRED